MTSTLPPYVQAFSGAIGSAVANAGSYPLDLVATKVQTSRLKKKEHDLKTAARMFRRVFETRGWSGLYYGLETDTGATLLSSFCYFYAYSFLRYLLVRRKTRSGLSQFKANLATLSVVEDLIIGFFAGISSRLISTPLTLVTVKLQKEKDEHDDLEHGEGQIENAKDETKGVVAVVKDLYDEGGLKGFWRGFSLTILLSCNPALTFTFTNLFLSGTTRKKPSAIRGFLAGALGNSFAVCIIYPLILAKTRISASAKRITIRQVLNDAIKKDGVGGLYQGLSVQVLKGFLNQGLTIMTKQRIEYRLLQICHALKKGRQ